MIKYREQFLDEIEHIGETLINKELPSLTKEAFYLFHETGNRIIYENAYFGRRKHLTVFGILSEYKENQKYVARLSEIIEEVCKEEFWALPAHVDFERLDKNTIDLFAAETAGTLSEMLCLFYDKLDEQVKRNAMEAVVKRVVEPFATSEIPYAWWEKDTCNWSAVCAGSIGMTAIYMKLLIEKYQDQHMQRMCSILPENWQEEILKRVCSSLHCYLEGMEADGACTEGLGYYSYGMSYFTGFVELYERIYGTERDVEHFMEIPKCREIALFQQKCYFNGGISLSFSDADRKENFLPGLTSYFKYCYPEVEVPDMSLARYFEKDNCYRWLTNERNIRWIDEYWRDEKAEKDSREDLKTYELPSAEWMIVQNKRNNGFAIKGGHNGESHNHNDIGSFLCAFEGDMLITDLGAGEYTKDYFGEKRYEILCNRSLGHSVPLIQGQEQKAGKEYHADAFVWDEKTQTLKVAFESAYEKGLIEKVIRTIHMEESKNGDLGEIMIQDCFVKKGNTGYVTENYVSMYKPEVMVMDGKVLIEGKNAVCVLTVDKRVNFEIKSKEHNTHDGKKRMVYLIQWKYKFENQKEITCNVNLSFFKKK